MISIVEKFINLPSPPPLIIKSIKILSTLLITGAIIWELFNLYARLNNLEIPSHLMFIFWIDRVALIAHFFEALLAAYYISLQGQNPIQYSIYIFFVGTVGLLELKTEKSGKQQ